MSIINFLNIIKIGYNTRKKQVKIKKNNISLNLLIFFYKKGLIDIWKENDNYININLRYLNNKPIFKKIKNVSTNGYKIYLKKYQNIKYYKDNIEIILNTSKGILTAKEAEQFGIGGEILFIIYY